MTATRQRRSSQDRFAERRRAATRRRGARRLRLVVGLTTVACLAVAAIAFLNSSLFDVDAITVTGFERADPERLIEVSGIEVGEPLLEVDLAGAAEAIEAEPWVGTAELDRSWAGTILITIVERGPIAALPAGAHFALIDDRGRQLDIVDRRPPGFLPISGVTASGVAGEAAPPEAAPAVSVLAVLTPALREVVTGLRLDRGDVLAELATGGVANLGDDRDLGRKMQSLETMLAQVDLACVEVIDVSVPSAPAVVRSAGEDCQ